MSRGWGCVGGDKLGGMGWSTVEAARNYLCAPRVAISGKEMSYRAMPNTMPVVVRTFRLAIAPHDPHKVNLHVRNNYRTDGT